MRGTWQTDDHAARGGLVLAVIGGALLLADSGAAAEIASAIVAALIAVAVVVVLAIGGGIAYLAYRARRERPAFTYRAEAGTRSGASDPAAQIGTGRSDFTPRVLEQPAARELHLHFHGTDSGQVAEQVAEILRRHQRPE
jgi:hypothetical protein